MDEKDNQKNENCNSPPPRPESPVDDDLKDPDYLPQSDTIRPTKQLALLHFLKQVPTPTPKKPRLDLSQPSTSTPSASFNEDFFDTDTDTAESSCSSFTSTSQLKDITNKSFPKKSALFDGKYFKIVEQKDTDIHIEAECQLCKKRIKGSILSTANYLRHIKTKHAGCYNQYLLYKQEKLKKNQCSKNEKKQIDIKTSLTTAKTKIDQSDFDKRLIKFVVKTMSAVSIIENPYFVQLFDGFNLKVMSRKKAFEKIREITIETKVKLKKTFENVNYLCTTADIWSSKTRSFLGVTGHWINNKFQRKSAALACQRFKGAHTYDRIAEMLENINLNYGLSREKLVATITDNGSNFLKAFREFGIKISEVELSHCDNDIGESDEEEEEHIEISVQRETVNEPNEFQLYELPNHIKCTTHTLSLIATADIAKFFSQNPGLRTRHTNIMHKCSLLWNKANRPKSAEIIKDILGHTLSYPGITRWNSFFDSISELLKCKEHLPILYEQLDLKNQCLKETELIYLEEYAQVLEPIAQTLDILQGEAGIFFGYVVPSLINLQYKLEKLRSKDLRYMNGVLDHVIRSLNERFKDFLTLTEKANYALIAAVTHPKFKMRWGSLYKGQRMLDVFSLQGLIIKEAKALIKQNESENEVLNANTTDCRETSFFEFESDIPTTELNSANSANLNLSLDLDRVIEFQLLQYLQDASTNLEMLDKYEYIKRLFFKFNTPLASSAPVERMFSLATFINRPRRNALTDENFENLVLAKANIE